MNNGFENGMIFTWGAFLGMLVAGGAFVNSLILSVCMFSGWMFGNWIWDYFKR